MILRKSKITIAFASSTLLVSHDPYTYNLAQSIGVEVHVQVKVTYKKVKLGLTPFVWQMKYEQIGSLGSLFLKSLN